MFSTLKSRLLCGLSVAGVAVGLASPAHAVLQIALSNSSAIQPACVDNTACDLNPAVGIIQLAPVTALGLTWDNVTVRSTGTPANPFAPNTITISGTLRNTNTGTAFPQATYTVADTNFASGVNAFATSVTGTWSGDGPSGSLFGIRSWADPTNTQWATGVPSNPANTAAAGLLRNFSCLPNDGGPSAGSRGCSDSLTGSVSRTSPFSMVQAGTFFIGPGISNTFVQTTTTTGNTVPVIPEPSTWAMMLLGFVGLGYAAFRQTTRRAKPLAL